MAKRIMAGLMIILSLCLVGCGDKTSRDEVTAMSVEQGFLPSTIYVGDEIETAGVLLLVTYSSGRVVSTTLDSAVVTGLDTSAAGNRTLTITYDGFSLQITYVVVEPWVIGMRYGGDTLVFYYGEDFDLSSVQVLVLYSSGVEVAKGLDEVDHTQIDQTPTAQPRPLICTFENFDCIISYVVLYRPIEAGRVYECSYFGQDLFCRLDAEESRLVLFEQDGEQEVTILFLSQLEQSELGSYTCSRVVVDGQLVEPTIYLSGSKVIIE